MRRLACRCGQRVYFENNSCTRCGRKLAFDPTTLDMASEPEPGDGLDFCTNRRSHSRCNWLGDPAASDGACIACRSSEVIPALSKAENRDRWRKLEQAKRRLIYDLLSLELPIDASRLRFVFKEDRRTNPDVHEEHVNIGHFEGVITINAAEADDVYREQMRLLMNEPYRTLLGHSATRPAATTRRCAGTTVTVRGPTGNNTSSRDTPARTRPKTGPRPSRTACTSTRRSRRRARTA